MPINALSSRLWASAAVGRWDLVGSPVSKVSQWKLLQAHRALLETCIPCELFILFFRDAQRRGFDAQVRPRCCLPDAARCCRNSIRPLVPYVYHKTAGSRHTAIAMASASTSRPSASVFPISTVSPCLPAAPRAARLSGPLRTVLLAALEPDLEPLSEPLSQPWSRFRRSCAPLLLDPFAVLCAVRFLQASGSGSSALSHALTHAL